MARPYFILIERANIVGAWAIQFGDYARRSVEFEREDRVEHGARRINVRVMRLANAKQETADAAIVRLNTV